MHYALTHIQFASMQIEHCFFSCVHPCIHVLGYGVDSCEVQGLLYFQKLQDPSRLQDTNASTISADIYIQFATQSVTERYVRCGLLLSQLRSELTEQGDNGQSMAEREERVKTCGEQH